MAITLNSAVRPIRIPRRAHAPSKEHDGVGTSSEPNGNLPAGWSLNERDEILNEEGLVMMDIREDLPLDQPAPLAQTSNTLPVKGATSPCGGTVPGSKTDDSPGTHSHQLPPHISQLLDQLELEEQLELQTGPAEEAEPGQSDDEPSADEFITPGDLSQELDNALNPAKESRQAYRLKEDDQNLKNWGKTGLDGLKNIFKTSPASLPVPSTSQQGEQSADSHPSACPAPPPPSSILSRSHTDKPISHDDDPGSSKPPQKKSVSFAPDTHSNPAKFPSTPSPVVPGQPRPSPGIVLSDVVEWPIIQPTPSISASSTKHTKPTKNEFNSKNTHLNPRLASLLPRSVQNRLVPYSNQAAENTASQQEEQGDDDSSGQDQCDLDSDEIDDGSSTWSDNDEAEGGSSWPPEDLDIQTALDLRQAALEYHTKRQGLGLGRGTGPLGGDRAPGSDDESEWVPLDARVQAPGVPRRSNGQSRFKTGRQLPPLDGTNPECRGGENVVDGKLFGAAPIIEGPAPTTGVAVHQLPGRSADCTELDDELTAEDLELLQARLEALGMDEERWIAAEKVGSELMAWMEKARTGEVPLEDGHQTDHMEPEAPLDLHQNILTPSQQPSLVERPSRNEGPPEVKTAPKSSALKSRLAIPKNPTAMLSAFSNSNGLSESESSYLDSQTIPQPNDKVNRTSSENDFSAQTSNDPQASATTTPKKLSRFKASKMGPYA